MSKIVNYYSNYGPGGRNCICCGPSPKSRKKHDRTAKRRERQAARREIVAEVAQG